MKKYNKFFVVTILGCGSLCTSFTTARQGTGSLSLPSSLENAFPVSKTSRHDNRPPMRTTSGGTNLFGFMSSSDISSMNPPRGLYEIGQYGETGLVYTDPAAAYYDKFSCAFLLDGCLYGYAESYFSDDFTNFGTPVFLKVDFNTGEVLQKEDIDKSISWVSPPAYNPDDGYFYFFTRDYEMARSTVSSPAEIEIVREYDNYMDNVISLAYCPDDRSLYGVNLNHRFIKIDFKGNQTVVGDIPDKSAHSTFQSAMTYSPAEGIFYWTYIGEDGATSLYTVTTQGLFNFECALDDNPFFDWFVTPDKKFIPEAPGDPVIRGIDFPDGSLSGIVSFTMPTAMQDGRPLPERVDWAVTVDGETVVDGQAAPGAEVTAETGSLEPGNHEFGVTVSINGTSGEPAVRRVWIGNDIPMAPASVTLTSTEVSWKPSSAGIHGGYVDTDTMTYGVRIDDMSGNTVFSAVTSATSVEYTLENPDALSLYTAFVTAKSNGLESTESSSGGILMGNAMTPPVFFTPTRAEFGMMTAFDKNSDNTCWMWNDEKKAIYSGYTLDDAMTPMDDYLFLPAMRFDSSDRIYQVSLDATAWSPTFADEYLDVVLATAPDYDGVIEGIIDRAKIPCAYDKMGNQTTDWKRLQGNFKVYEPGIYYIGIHCSSDPQMAGTLIRNIFVNDDSITDSSPSMAEEATATAAPEGRLSARVSFRFPTTTVDGTPIPGDEQLSANVESPLETATVTGMPGGYAETSVATSQGENEIGIIVSNRNGENSFKAVAKVFTGQAIPSSVTDVKGVVSDDMLHLTLTWKAPAAGANDGYIDPSQVTYNIYLYNPLGIASKWTPLEKGLTECSFTFSPDTQDYYRIAVEPVNIAGAGPMMTGAAWVGPAYTLPYSDDFSDSDEIYQTKPWRIFYDGYYAEWTFMRLNMIDPALYGETNDKIAMYCGGVEGSSGRVSMPRFATTGVGNAKLALESYTGSRAASVTIYGYSTHHSSQLVKIGTLPVDKAEGIGKVSFILPKEFMDEEWVQILIDVDIEDEGDYFAMTSAAVSSVSGVEEILHTSGSVVAGRNSIRLINLMDSHVVVSSAAGHTVFSGKVADDDMELYLPSGVYVVKAGDKTLKTIVR